MSVFSEFKSKMLESVEHRRRHNTHMRKVVHATSPLASSITRISTKLKKNANA